MRRQRNLILISLLLILLTLYMVKSNQMSLHNSKVNCVGFLWLFPWSFLWPLQIGDKTASSVSSLHFGSVSGMSGLLDDPQAINVAHLISTVHAKNRKRWSMPGIRNNHSHLKQMTHWRSYSDVMKERTFSIVKPLLH